MKPVFLVPFLVAASAWADEKADRASIDRAIAALNDPARRAAVFAKGVDSEEEFRRLLNTLPVPFRVTYDAVSPPSPGVPVVVISHEPWGEATIAMGPLPKAEPVQVTFESGPIRFLTPDVAVVEGALHAVTNPPNGEASPVRPHIEIPVLFVMLREGADWKIGSLRLLMQRADVAHR
jgi:hypothetical protein